LKARLFGFVQLREFHDRDLKRLDLSALVYGRFQRRNIPMSSLVCSQCAFGVAAHAASN
jgi:hypothetical protein